MTKRLSHYRSREYLRGTSPVLLVPFLDILLILIGFFIASTAMIKKGQIPIPITQTFLQPMIHNENTTEAAMEPSVPLQSETQSESSFKENYHPLHLKIGITNKGVRIYSDSKKILPRTIPYTEDQNFDIKAIQTQLHEVKELFPDESAIVLTPNPNVPYHRILTLLDILRGSDANQTPFSKIFLNPEEDL